MHYKNKSAAIVEFGSASVIISAPERLVSPGCSGVLCPQDTVQIRDAGASLHPADMISMRLACQRITPLAGKDFAQSSLLRHAWAPEGTMRLVSARQL